MGGKQQAPGGKGGDKGGPGAQGQQGEGKKKINYAGPDPDLAQMLERDMMDQAPGIRWGSCRDACDCA